MSERRYYVLCEDNCRFESMTKEQIIAAIAEATGHTPENIDDAFITQLKEQNRGDAIKIWVGTQAEYNALTPEDNVLYLFEDSSEWDDVLQAAEGKATEVCNDRLGHFKKVLYDGKMVSNASGDITLTLDGLSDYDVIMINGKLLSRTQSGIFNGSDTIFSNGSAEIFSYRADVNGDTLTIKSLLDSNNNCRKYSYNGDVTSVVPFEVSFNKIIGVM